MRSDDAEMQVVDVMHRGVVACDRDMPALAAARMMAAHRIHSVVVISCDGVPRLVTDAEIATAFYAGTLEDQSVDEIARPAAFVRLSDTLDFALERMHEGKTTHAVVVERTFRPVGIISVLDLAEARTAA
jgi:CBS domain-containing protein